MITVRDVFHKLSVSGDVGIEIEVEGENLPVVRGSWKVERDGSLRGESCEYVLRRPCPINDIDSRLSEISDAYKEAGSKVDESFRAGVHVHVNCQKLSMVQLYNFITLYLVFEEILVGWCGKTRQGNLFCLRASDAEFMLSFVRRKLVEARPKNTLMGIVDTFGPAGMIRYSSMNLEAVSKYGSLEFRAMRSTKDMGSISAWARMLVQLRDIAAGMPDPQSIMFEFSHMGIEAFTEKCLGGYFDALTKGHEHDWRSLVREGMRNAQEIAYSIDWEWMYKRFEKDFSMPPKINLRDQLVVNDEILQHIQIPRANPR